MPVQVKVVIKMQPPDLHERLRGAQFKVGEALRKETDLQNQYTISHIVEKRMTGKGPFPSEQGKVGVRTGHLRRSLRASKAVFNRTHIRSAIGTNVKYAGILEFGGQTRPHTITAKKGKSLRFPGRGSGPIFRRSVKHPGSKFPARFFIYRGITDRAKAIGEGMSAAALKALAGGGTHGPNFATK